MFRFLFLLMAIAGFTTGLLGLGYGLLFPAISGLSVGTFSIYICIAD